MACDPAVLISQATCINACIPQGMMPAVNTSLLCQILNGAFTSELLDGLVHYWKLEEGSGSSRLDSVGSSNLSETSGAVAGVTGVHGNGAQTIAGSFLRKTSFVASTPWSFAFWVNMTTFIGGSDVAEVGDGGLTGPYFTSDAAGIMNVGNGTDGTVITKSIGALNTWHLVVFTVIANGTYSLSIDNSVFATAVAPTPPAPATAIEVIVSDTSGGSALQGVIDEVAFWSRALTQADVTSLWNNGKGRFLS